MPVERRLLGEFEQMIVAAVLRLGADAYGVTIIEDIARHAGRRVRSGALSVTLDRMERKGLLRSRAGGSAGDAGDPSDTRGGRPRRYIELTPAGLAAARDARSALLAMWKDLDGVYEGS
jgi:DNA-binding PadR family transcriptional regulator